MLIAVGVTHGKRDNKRPDPEGVEQYNKDLFNPFRVDLVVVILTVGFTYGY